MHKERMSHPMYIRSEAMRTHWQDNEQYMKTRCTYGTQRGTYYVNGGVINGIVVLYMTRSMRTSRGFMRILLTEKMPEWRK